MWNEPRKRRKASPLRREVSLSTQFLSGLAAMVVTMGLLAATLPPEEVSGAGRSVLAGADPAGRPSGEIGAA